MSDAVCTLEDEYTRQQWLTRVRWFARLSSGVVVIGDDDRPGLEQPSAWLRLRDHVTRHGLAVEEVWLQFRDEPPVRLPARAGGYFFRRSVGAFLNAAVSFDFYLVGYLQGRQVVVHRIKVPEMILVETEARDPDDAEAVGPSLIRNP
jgi:hypothetical protein